MDSTKEIQEFINKKGVCFNQYYSKEEELDILVCHKDTIKIEDIPQIIKNNPCDTIEQPEQPEQSKDEVKEEKITATEMMVNDMQEEEYYRIKHTPTPNEWIEKVAMNIVYQLDDDANLSVEFRQANNDKRIDFVKGLIQSSLTQQKEAIETEKYNWGREVGIKECLEIIKGFESGKIVDLIEKIKSLIQ